MKSKKKIWLIICTSLMLMALFILSPKSSANAAELNEQSLNLGNEINVSVPHEWNVSAGNKTVRYSITERAVNITLVTDGFKENYAVGGGNSYAIWTVNFQDGKHEYKVQCRTPYGKAGNFAMEDMNYSIMIKTQTGGGTITWTSVPCAHVINGNELTWSASLPENLPAFQDEIDADHVTITSYLIHEYQDPNVPVETYKIG